LQYHAEKRHRPGIERRGAATYQAAQATSLLASHALPRRDWPSALVGARPRIRVPDLSSWCESLLLRLRDAGVYVRLHALERLVERQLTHEHLGQAVAHGVEDEPVERVGLQVVRDGVQLAYLRGEDVERVDSRLRVTDVVDALVSQPQVAGDEQRAGVELTEHVFAGQVLHEASDLFRVLGVRDTHQRCSAWHARAGGRAAGVGNDLPVERVPDE